MATQGDSNRKCKRKKVNITYFKTFHQTNSFSSNFLNTLISNVGEYFFVTPKQYFLYNCVHFGHTNIMKILHSMAKMFKIVSKILFGTTTKNVHQHLKIQIIK
ncbi:hypothetical protein ACF0H5_002961 [Mactra antiquata]